MQLRGETLNVFSGVNFDAPNGSSGNVPFDRNYQRPRAAEHVTSPEINFCSALNVSRTRASPEWNSAKTAVWSPSSDTTWRTDMLLPNRRAFLKNFATAG